MYEHMICYQIVKVHIAPNAILFFRVGGGAMIFMISIIIIVDKKKHLEKSMVPAPIMCWQSCNMQTTPKCIEFQGMFVLVSSKYTKQSLS